MNSCHRLHLNIFLRTASAFFFVLFLHLFLTASSQHAAEASENPQPQVIIPPFAIETRTPQPHLQTGLANILATRIGEKTGYIIAPHSSETDSLEALLQQHDNAAMQKMIQGMKNISLLAGTLKEKEKGYEIIIQVFSSQSTAQLALSRTFNRLDSTLSTLDELALDIAEKVFSLPRPEKTESIPSDNGFQGFRTAHPERIFKEKRYSDEKGEKNEKTDADITQAAVKKNGLLETQSSRKDILPSSTALAMAAGDLDKDGKNEFVVLEKANVVLYHRNPDSSFQAIAFQPVASHLGLHTVHLADLDHNGLQELYIGASSGSNPASQILEWDGKQFRILYQNAPYYLRPSVDAQGRPFLLGQEGLIGKTDSAAFYSLEREADGSLKKIKQLHIPPGFNIYDFIRVDLDRDGMLEFIGISPSNKLTVIDSSGRTLWKSAKNYGASREILGTLSSTVDGDRNPTNNPASVYMHSRIIAQDLDGDGTAEIILGRNRLADTMFFRRLRAFEGSSIAALHWSGETMRFFWESPKMSGYTVDFQILRDPGSLGGFRLLSIEQEHTNNTTSFWKRKESFVHSYILEGKNTSQD